MGFSKYKWHKFAETAADLQWTPGDVAGITVNGKKLCVGRFQPPGDPSAPQQPATAQQLFGFAHLCPHAGAPMTDAYVDRACNVVCPVHQLKFNLKNGRDVNGEGYKLKIYPVEVRPDGLYIGLEEGGLFKWF